MCGVSCAFNARSILTPNDFKKQSALLNHRGPDFQDIWVDSDNKCYLGHNRLSIIDLNKTGNQPMMSNSGRFVISFNGEIYNYLDLKEKIKKTFPDFQTRGSSDTEVLLAGIELFGLDNCLKWIRGMFAIILYDRKYSQIHLIRDSVGEKPIYYFSKGNILIAASELKFFKFLRNRLSLSRKALSVFLAQGNIPAPFSIFKEIKKVMPGSYITFTAEGKALKNTYWDIRSKEERTLNWSNPREINEEFEKLFQKSVKNQMISDVPLGAFLSGGIDSSSVVAAMVENSSNPIKTISIGFSEDEYDESKRAKEIAKYLGTNHEEYFVSSEDAKNIVPDLASISCEPFGDSSIIPTYFLTKYARNELTVCLSGDGGDELFGGCRRHIEISRIEKFFFLLPSNIKLLVVKILTKLIRGNSSKASNSILKSLLNLSSIDDQFFKILRVLNSDDIKDLYYKLLFQSTFEDNLIDQTDEINPVKIIENITKIDVQNVEDIRVADFLNYLPNDILVKVDRAAMSNSLETRIPFLDRDLIHFAFSLKMKNLSNGNTGKLPVRDFLYKRVPAKLLSQPKTGFGIPLKNWLSGDLKDWAEDLIFSSNDNGLINVLSVRNMWNDFINLEEPNHHKIWNGLIFYSWHKQFYN